MLSLLNKYLWYSVQFQVLLKLYEVCRVFEFMTFSRWTVFWLLWILDNVCLPFLVDILLRSFLSQKSVRGSFLSIWIVCFNLGPIWPLEIFPVTDLACSGLFGGHSVLITFMWVSLLIKAVLLVSVISLCMPDEILYCRGAVVLLQSQLFYSKLYFLLLIWEFYLFWSEHK